MPPVVQATAIAFRDEAGARALFAIGGEWLAHVLSVRDGVLQPIPARQIGDESTLFTTPSVHALGRRGPGAAILWRTANIVSFVFAGGLGGQVAHDVVLGLADKQQARIANPTPLTRAERDDLEVVLDNPREPAAWERYKRTRMGRILWDLGCLGQGLATLRAYPP